MSTYCSKCGQELQTEGELCPKCGEKMPSDLKTIQKTEEAPADSKVSTKKKRKVYSANGTITRKSWLEGTKASFGRLSTVLPMAIGVCGILYFLGFHSLALNLALGALVMVIITPLIWAKNFRVGNCPYCGNEIHGIPTRGFITCQACEKKVVFRDKHFHCR